MLGRDLKAALLGQLTLCHITEVVSLPLARLKKDLKKTRPSYAIAGYVRQPKPTQFTRVEYRKATNHAFTTAGKWKLIKQMLAGQRYNPQR
jgi:hypothetical protein